MFLFYFSVILCDLRLKVFSVLLLFRSSFSLWCAIKAPLMLGSDLRNMIKGDENYQVGEPLNSCNLK